MNTENRLGRLSTIRAALASGRSEHAACMRAGVTVAWWKRWRDAESLSDAPRPGRPASCEVTADDADKLARAFIRSNRGRGRGSMTMAARMLAVGGELSPDLGACILKPRASKHRLPTPVRRAMAGLVDQAMVAKYRDPKMGQGPNDGISIEGFLRMKKSRDGRDLRPLEPGERQVWDDGSVNVGLVAPWPWPNDPCARRFGCRLGRYQLLLGIDCATDRCRGWRLVVRERDAYGEADIVRTLWSVWRDNAEIPAEIVVEGGSWQSNRTLEFIRIAGVEAISAKGIPRRKLVEGYFNRLWTALSIALPPRGQVGRFRGEMKKETAEWCACREGRLDPRGRFPSIEEFTAAMDVALNYLDNEVVESDIYGFWRPMERWASRTPMVHNYHSGLAAYAMPVREVCKVSKAGTISVIVNPAPHGLKHKYVFACEGLYQLGKQDVTVLFDPWAISAGAVIKAKDGREMVSICVSPAPDVLSAAGYYDPSKPAKEMKIANRKAVVEAVHALDDRRVFLPSLPALPAADAPIALRLPDLSPQPEAPVESDFAALETAAGIW